MVTALEVGRLARIELVLVRAAVLAADRFDEVSESVVGAMTAAHGLLAMFPSVDSPVVVGLERMTAGECVLYALEEARAVDWDGLAVDHGARVTDLRIALGDCARGVKVLSGGVV